MSLQGQRWPSDRRQPVLVPCLDTKRKRRASCSAVICLSLFQTSHESFILFHGMFPSQGKSNSERLALAAAQGTKPCCGQRPACLRPGCCPAASGFYLLSIFQGSCIRGICLPVDFWSPNSQTSLGQFFRLFPARCILFLSLPPRFLAQEPPKPPSVP